MISQCAYREQNAFNPLTSNHRYELLQSDFAALYRKYNQLSGIDVALAPEYNLDNWLNPKHAHFKPELQKAIFYYCSRADREECLKICVATKEMDEAAWKFGHKNQIILDGTFGVCTTRLLLFISMGVDVQGHGVPLALFLFSAPTGSRATHAGYNTEILAELLDSWKTHLGNWDGHPFCPAVAITDTNTKERAALTWTWPLILLLLCHFHVHQCWTNKQKKLLPLKETRKEDGTVQSFWREHISGRLFNLEKAYIAVVYFLKKSLT